jgi:hypothetical protein
MLERLHNFCEGRLPAFQNTIRVMNISRTIDRKPDEEFVLGKEFAPFIVNQNTIRLKGIMDYFTARVFLLELDNPPEEIDSKKCRFSTLPGKCNFIYLLNFDVLPNKGSKNFFTHPPLLVPWIEFFFLKIETVCAVKITERPSRLRHDMEGRGILHFSYRLSALLLILKI